MAERAGPVAQPRAPDLRGMLTATGTLVPNAGGFENRWFASAGRPVGAQVVFRFGSHRLGQFLVSHKYAGPIALTELIEAGKVAPVLDRTYPLSETGQAISHVGAGHARGKVAISI